MDAVVQDEQGGGRKTGKKKGKRGAKKNKAKADQPEAQLAADDVRMGETAGGVRLDETTAEADGMPSAIDISPISTAVSEADDIPEKDDRAVIEEWLKYETSPAWVNNLALVHRTKLIDHIYNHKNPDDNQNWNLELRQLFWRNVIRANFFWVNPDTGLPTGKPKPIHYPDGAHVGDFNLFIMCAAERADRVGRDLPFPEYVKEVEDEVRSFLSKAQEERDQFQHLAFLLMFDEEQKRVLGLGELQDRIGRTFQDIELDSSKFTMIKAGPPVSVNQNVEMAEKIWHGVSSRL
ncbi:hypothetical protein LTR37_004661 [Vermiconidia calcicola]|uniref:Uncharacterized protein n=1 Tax=Vermiconidia calcicola TaxID=1690605 RepID=A0ACC3NMJ1_9PEZI|nr:hypothetical protein LTR37_004661 [Vermiconidia calcicola]